MKRIMTILMAFILLCSLLTVKIANAEDENVIDESFLTEEVVDETDQAEETEVAGDPFVEEEDPVDESLPVVEEVDLVDEVLPVVEENEATTDTALPDEGNDDGNGFTTPPLTFHGGKLDAEASKHTADPEADAARRASIPSSYSLVDQGYVTSVKNQDPYGTCWTFAAMASAESGVLMKYGKTLDLAELQLAYYGWNNYNIADPLSLITKDGNKYTPKSDLYNAGGWDLTAVFALASGIGFSDESKYPYGQATTYLNGSGSNPCYSAQYKLRSARILSISETDVIKDYLMNYGALAVSYYHSNSYYNETNGAYYQNSYDQRYANHAVTLVGWNDNYDRTKFNSSKRPSKNGAWLIKNSWGTGWGNKGYFWISYEDTSFKNNVAIFYEAEYNKNYKSSNEHLYQYDGSSQDSYVVTCSGTGYAANIYQAKYSQELLQEVGFAVDGADLDYEISIYKGVTTSNPVSGTLAYTQTGHITDGGYYLIPLTKAVYLEKGQKFSVVVKLTSDNTFYIFVDYAESWSYSDGSSFAFYNDVSNEYSFCNSDGSWNSLTSEGATARIKAVTVTRKSLGEAIRIYRKSRLSESIKTADELKSVLGVSKFDTIIVAKDSDFADALSGSYLAARKSCPILLVNTGNYDDAKTYIKSNVSSGGTVYVLGSTDAVAASFEKGLSGYTVTRLEGSSRYYTNLAILKEAGLTSSKAVIVVTGSGFADSLSAGSVGLPILMVDNSKTSLKSTQTSWLQKSASSSRKIYILGDENAVNASLAKELKNYGKVTRIGGSSRWETTKLVAEKFFPKTSAVVMATGTDFADGLIAAPLAKALKAPVLMVSSDKVSNAKAYVQNNSVTKAYVVGSKDYVSDAAVKKILMMSDSATITER